ncbi:FAD-binding protein [Euzebya tangerina]|uniref:FAD-binding protein n=1 Tax=Euzebya tangerina TaxID=591198 RepID=UPI00196A4E70|nr:FAD-binding protein [Euzebya tangerina]
MIPNWAGNHQFSAVAVEQPESMAALRRLVSDARRVRAAGQMHSFSRAADTAGVLVRLDRMGGAVEVDSTRRRARVPAGWTYADVAGALHGAGLALENLASVLHISVAGAVATATHGSGLRRGNLATQVAAVELVLGSGDVVEVDRTDTDGAGVVVALGCLGVVTALTLDVRPTYRVAQRVVQDVPLEALTERLEDVMCCGDSVSLFTTWRQDVVEQVWVKDEVPGEDVGRLDDKDALPGRGLDLLLDMGGTAATTDLDAVGAVAPPHVTAQRGTPGPWHQRLPHFRAAHNPASGAERQSEYMIDLAAGPAAARALRHVGPQLRDALIISEVRVAAADELWLSPMYGRETLCLHFTWNDDDPAVTHATSVVERALEPFEPRPHWGKLSHLDLATVADRYPAIEPMRALRDRLDPDRTFGNTLTDRLL